MDLLSGAASAGNDPVAQLHVSDLVDCTALHRCADQAMLNYQIHVAHTWPVDEGTQAVRCPKQLLDSAIMWLVGNISQESAVNAQAQFVFHTLHLEEPLAHCLARLRIHHLSNRHHHRESSQDQVPSKHPTH